MAVMVFLAMRAFCIAKGEFASWRSRLTRLVVLTWVGLAPPLWAQAPVPASGPDGRGTVVRHEAAAMAVPVPRVTGKLRAADIGLIINTRDAYSVAIGAYYRAQRGLRPEQVLQVDLPLRPALTPEEFEGLKDAVARRFGPRIQALALAWSLPYAVNCNSITGALALGFDGELCRSSCAASRASPYANSRSTRPFTDLGLRPSMLLAAPNVAEGRALIDRGVRSDRSLALAGGPPVIAAFVSSKDPARNVRERLYPPPGDVRRPGVQIRRLADLADATGERLVLVQTGVATIVLSKEARWAPGALADHLTSFGGQLDSAAGQSTALDWIGAGATASHGTVSEPCNHLQKFPHPQWLLWHYLQGSTAIEAYWKSVLWPQQSLFVGEPLAAPFARR